jgi:hypothetical protein
MESDRCTSHSLLSPQMSSFLVPAQFHAIHFYKMPCCFRQLVFVVQHFDHQIFGMSFTQNTMIVSVVYPFALCCPFYGFNQRSCALTSVAFISQNSLICVKVITC